MGNVISTNVLSLNAQRNLYSTNNSLSTAMQRLSSGLRINSAKDDAAGLQISNRLTSQINGLNQAVSNASDGISLAQVAEGALQESTNTLQRMRELALQASNGTLSGEDRSAVQQEITQLQAELNRISDTTAFGGRNLLDGSFGTKSLQVGSESNQTINISIDGARASDIGSNQFDFTGSELGFVATAAATAAANSVGATNLTINGPQGSATIADTTFAAGSSARDIAGFINAESASTGVSSEARTGARLSGFTTTGSTSFTLQGEGSSSVNINVNLTSTSDLGDLAKAINQSSSTTGITAVSNGSSIDLFNEKGDDIVISAFDVGTADDNTGQMTVTNLEFDGSVGSSTTNVIDSGSADATRVIGEVRTSSAGAFTLTGDSATTINGADSSALSSVATIDVSTQLGAQSAIDVIDAAIASIDGTRAGLGAVQNRLSSTISNLQSISQNVSSARSQIRDADFAQETAELSRNQVLQQAGLSMLTQANASTQSVLALLQ